MKDLITLPLPDQGDGEVSVSDLFLKYFARKVRSDVTLGGLSCGCKGAPVSQCRVLKWPNVLLVQVGRQIDGQADVSRQHVRAEVRLELPGLGMMELAAVVYHVGRQVTTGHYTCACRGTDGMFWYFDDLTRRDSGCRRLSGDVEQFLPRRVYLMVYVRPQSKSEFAGMGDVPQKIRDGSGGAAVWPQDGLGPVEQLVTPRAPSMTVVKGQSAVAQGQAASASSSATLGVSAESTPVKSPPEKIRRVCTECKNVYEDDEDVRLSTPMSVETPVWSPVAKCPRCGPSPGRVGDAGVAGGLRVLPSAPTWPFAGASAGEMQMDAVPVSLRAVGSADVGNPASGCEPLLCDHDSGATLASLAGSTMEAMVSASQEDLRQSGSVYAFLRSRLVELGLGEGIVRMLEGNEVSRKAVDSDWSVSWEGWARLVVELLSVLAAKRADAVEVAFGCVSETVRRFLFLAESEVNVPVAFPTDMARVAQLRAEGWELRRGEVWERGDCLADSLLQLLIVHGILPEELNANAAVGRNVACAAVRSHLRQHADADLRPRNAAGVEDPEAYLEHQRHAAEILSFFFALRGGG